MMLYGCTRVSARGHAVSDGGDKHVNRHLDWRPAKLVLTKDMVIANQYEILGITPEEQKVDSENYDKALRLIELERRFPRPSKYPQFSSPVNSKGLISTGSFPRDIWLRIMIPLLGASQLLQLEKTGKFFYYTINFCDKCESQDL